MDNIRGTQTPKQDQECRRKSMNLFSSAKRTTAMGRTVSKTVAGSACKTSEGPWVEALEPYTNEGNKTQY